MVKVGLLAAAVMVVGVSAGMAQAAPAAGAQAPAGQAAPQLQLHSLGQQGGAGTPDPFPPVNVKNFSAQSPNVATVNSFLTALWGYDPNRLFKVFGIQPTQAPGVSRVTVLISDKGPNAKVQPTIFFVTPDGKHAVAGDAVIDFGARPFQATREVLQARADGPAKGAAGKELELVEFADMQCPHCKEAQASMDRLQQDFPNARIVYENFPLAQIHPFANQAALMGVCVAKQKPDAFWTYLQAVYDTQGGLTAEDGDATLKAAVQKAGVDPAAVATCAALPATAATVQASLKLGEDVGVEQTPTLVINGHLVPVSPAAIPYETLKSIVQFQAQQDGVK